MWEWIAANSLLAPLFGEYFGHATQNWGEIKRKSLGMGFLPSAIIWLLSLFGEYLIPPLAVLRQCCGERAWILGKIVLCLLALPVGFPIAYCFTRRHLIRKAEKAAREAELNQGTDPAVSRTPNQFQIKARQIQRIYTVVIDVLLWFWYWFLTPARSWLEQGGQELLPKTMGLLVLWFLLIAILGTGGGRIVYRLAERHFRRRI